MTLSPADVQAAAHLIRGSKVVVCQLEVPPETSLEALRLAKQNGVVTIFNTAPAVPLSDDFFHSTDILVLNETEVCQYTCRWSLSLIVGPGRGSD
jgi:ribokinase